MGGWYSGYVHPSGYPPRCTPTPGTPHPGTPTPGEAGDPPYRTAAPHGAVSKGLSRHGIDPNPTSMLCVAIMDRLICVMSMKLTKVLIVIPSNATRLPKEPRKVSLACRMLRASWGARSCRGASAVLRMVEYMDQTGGSRVKQEKSKSNKSSGASSLQKGCAPVLLSFFRLFSEPGSDVRLLVLFWFYLTLFDFVNTVLPNYLFLINLIFKVIPEVNLSVNLTLARVNRR